MDKVHQIDMTITTSTVRGTRHETPTLREQRPQPAIPRTVATDIATRPSQNGPRERTLERKQAPSVAMKRARWFPLNEASCSADQAARTT